MGAAIDQPGIEPLAAGIQPEFAAVLERSGTVATAAGEERLRRGAGSHPPLNEKKSGHLLGSFVRKVHRDDGGRARMAGS